MDLEGHDVLEVTLNAGFHYEMQLIAISLLNIKLNPDTKGTSKLQGDSQNLRFSKKVISTLEIAILEIQKEWLCLTVSKFP